jgi:hypothetical protein
MSYAHGNFKQKIVFSVRIALQLWAAWMERPCGSIGCGAFTLALTSPTLVRDNLPRMADIDPNRHAPRPTLPGGNRPVHAENNVRHLLRDEMGRSAKGREVIACKMSEILGRTITRSMLADFTRNATRKRQVRFPAGWVSAFCEAVGSDELALSVIGPELRGIIELREEQINWLAKSLRAELLKPKRRGSKPKGKRTRKA